MRHYYQYSFDLPISNPQRVTFELYETDPALVILLNHILLYLFVKKLFKAFIYITIEKFLNSFDLEKVCQEMKEKLKLSLKNGGR